MNKIIRVAKTEILEQRRQPSMLFILVLNYLVWGSAFIIAIAAVSAAAEDPKLMGMISQHYLNELGITDPQKAYSTLFKLINTAFGSLLFTNLALFVAIMSSYSVINDREHGTLPFLMLTRLSRFELILGKVLGVLAIPTLLHFIFVGSSTLIVRQIDAMAPHADKFGGSPAWWLAFLFGAPLSGFFVGAFGTLVSSLSRDIRTSIQFISFVIGFFSLLCGFVLFDGISLGVVVQLSYIVGLALGSLFLVFIASYTLNTQIR